MESEKRPFQFIRNKLRHRSFAVYCLCCLNISKNKLHWCNTQCCLLGLVWSLFGLVTQHALSPSVA